MMTHKYSILVRWSGDENAFVATSAEFRYISASGSTRAEAFGEMLVALEGAIEVCQAEGWPLPEPNTLDV